MCTISLSLAKPGKAMPGPYSSLMVLRRRASRSGAGRAVRGRKTQDSADGALIRLLTSNKAYRTRRVAARAVGTDSGFCQIGVFTPGSCPRQRLCRAVVQTFDLSLFTF